MMQLTGRTVMFDYLLQLGARDVNMLLVLSNYVVANPSLLAHHGGFSGEEWMAAMDLLRAQLRDAQIQIEATRRTFSGDKVKNSVMSGDRPFTRGLDIKVVDAPDELETPA